MSIHTQSRLSRFSQRIDSDIMDMINEIDQSNTIYTMLERPVWAGNEVDGEFPDLNKLPAYATKWRGYSQPNNRTSRISDFGIYTLILYMQKVAGKRFASEYAHDFQQMFLNNLRNNRYRQPLGLKMIRPLNSNSRVVKITGMATAKSTTALEYNMDYEVRIV